jgi:biotin carboxylase
MTSVVFVAPYGLQSTLRFLRAAARLPGVRFGVVSQEPAAAFARKLPAEERPWIEGYARVENALDPDQLEAGVRRLGRSLGGSVDRLLAILENAQEAVAVVCERLGIRGMDLEEARRFRDKAHMKETLRAHGLPCARHLLATNARDALAFAEQLLPLVAKPPAGAGAKDTFRVEELRQLESWVRSSPPTPERPLLLEEFVRGTEHSFDSVSLGGEHVFHSISRYAPTPLEVMETPWLQWTVLLPRRIDGPEFAAIRDAGPRALTALGMVSGMTHMEWFRRPDGSIAISEVAARPPGAQFTTLISHAHERDFYRAWAEACVFERFDPPERLYACGAAYLRGQGFGQVVDIHGVEQARRELGDLVVESRLPQKGQLKATSYEGEGFVILRHPETSVVEEGLKRLVTTLKIELGADAKSGEPS